MQKFIHKDFAIEIDKDGKISISIETGLDIEKNLKIYHDMIKILKNMTK